MPCYYCSLVIYLQLQQANYSYDTAILRPTTYRTYSHVELQHSCTIVYNNNEVEAERSASIGKTPGTGAHIIAKI